MKMKSKYILKYSLNGDEDTSILEIKLEPIKGLLHNKNCNVVVPNVYLNGFIYDEYDDILEGYVNVEFAMEELSSLYRTNLKKRYRKEKKQFRLIKEEYK